MAAKVTLGAFVAGCGGSVDLGAPGGTGGSGGGAAAIEDAGSTGDPPAVCSLPATGLPSDAAEQCCEGLVAATFPDDGGAIITGADAATPDVTACCKAVITYHDAKVADGMPDDGKLTYTQLYDCCGVVQFPSGPTCTPWGPPVPPAVPALLDVDAWLSEVA